MLSRLVPPTAGTVRQSARVGIILATVECETWEVPKLRPESRWKIRASRHLIIQTAAFVGLIVIAVICAFSGNWALAGVFVLLALFPGMMSLAMIRTMRSVNRRANPKATAKPSD